MNSPWAFISEPLVEWHGGAANSLSRRVTEADAVTRSYEILARLRQSGQGRLAGSGPLLDSRLRFLNWLIQAHRLSSNSGPVARKAGRLLVKLLQKYKQLLDRLPTSPRMHTAPV